VQLFDEIEPLGATAFGTHDVQFSLPIEILKVLTGQRSQKSIFKLLRVRYRPAMHLQALNICAPNSVVIVFTGHDVHV